MSKENWFFSGLITGITVLMITVFVIEQVFSPPTEPVAEVAPMEAPALIMRVSAYCPGPCCCGKWADGTTASGMMVRLIVAAPPNIPFGTVLKIPGYGVAAVQDRGSAITGNRLDVLFPTHAEALAFGVQWLKVRKVE